MGLPPVPRRKTRLKWVRLFVEDTRKMGLRQPRRRRDLIERQIGVGKPLLDQRLRHADFGALPARFHLADPPRTVHHLPGKQSQQVHHIRQPVARQRGGACRRRGAFI